MVATRLTPPEGPLRVKPQDGEARCILEILVQHLWRYRIGYYVAVVSTLSLVLQLGGVGK